MYFLKERIRVILNDLKDYMYPVNEKIPEYLMKEGSIKGTEAVDFDTEGWSVFAPGERWGGRDRHFWFRTRVEIPAAFDGKTVVYSVRTGREGQWDALNPQLLVYVNGKIVQGLDVNHCEIVLSENTHAGDIYNIALYAYGGMKEGLVELDSKISVLDRLVEKLYYDIKIPHEITELLDSEDKNSIDILNYINDAINILDLRKPFSEGFNQSVKKAIELLDTEFYGKFCGHEDIIAQCVGHTHIDVAWLWTLAQTREKTVRSFSTVLNLMKQYPEYTFMSSQPQLYKFMKEEQPELYNEIKQRVKEGRWEPEGAMWLEADCNLSSGESLVRQILFGTRFFEQEFKVKNRILWLPDVFGYSVALPQILKKSGIDYFMTTKISWNEYNKMPYDTFMWKGMDGTEILTQFITTTNYEVPKKSHGTTYVGNLIPTQIMGAWQRYQQKNLRNEVLICYGHGDGGGGPTKEMLENGRRMGKGIPGCPKVEMTKSLDFFVNLEQKVMKDKKLPKWVGELYLEFHRGTYTSMARNKKYNRKSEFLYQDAECLSVFNNIVSGVKYPLEKINQGWETILLNQFHDILPGSSIKEVYEDSRNDYLRVLESGNNVLEKALESIASKITLDEISVIVFNQLSFERSDVVEFTLPEEFEAVSIRDYKGNIINAQMVNGNKVIFFAENVPSKGYKAFKIIKSDTMSENNTQMIVTLSDRRKADLTNKYFDIKLDESAEIISIFDKTVGREVVKAGEKANVLQAFEDKPYEYDAWEISIYYQEKMWQVNHVESIDITENGPVRAGLRICRRFLDSLIIQDVYIYSNIPKIDFKTWIDWKEKQVLLKAAFPVDIHTDKATYDVQFGNTERPTHWNTSWDYARFEVCAHKWVDLSEEGYGVSLMNDCKYGHDIKDGVMRLTLLKSAISPNEVADKEVHEFTYSIYPHGGDWKGAGTVDMAYALNCPMYIKLEDAHEGELSAELSMMRIDKGNVIIETVKKAEDSDDIIVRVYECYNRRTNANITFFKELEQVWECDLMENNLTELSLLNKEFGFEIKPYEIKTFKIKYK